MDETEHKRGKCEGCDKDPRILAQIESGQWLCRTCMKVFRPSRPKNLATPNNIRYLRGMGFYVDDNLTKEEAHRILDINSLRVDGVAVPIDVTDAELDRLLRIQEFRHQKIAVSDHASFADIAAIEAKCDRVRHLFTKAVGVTFDNDDGSRRQDIIVRCRPGDGLVMKNDPTDPQYPRAVKVCRENGEQIGFLDSRLADDLLSELGRGCNMGAHVMQVTGGGPGESYGMNIIILVTEPGVSNAEAQEYLDGLDLTDQKRKGN